jgi:hypothetical protein
LEASKLWSLRMFHKDYYPDVKAADGTVDPARSRKWFSSSVLADFDRTILQFASPTSIASAAELRVLSQEYISCRHRIVQEMNVYFVTREFYCGNRRNQASKYIS